nr:M1 family metallopeptidase [Allomuricauda sp.]
MRFKLVFSFLFVVFSHLSGMAQPNIDFTRLTAEIIPLPKTKEIRGQGVYTFELLGKMDSIRIDAVNMDFHKLVLDGKPVTFNNNGTQLAIKAPKKLGVHSLNFSYSAKPKQTVYFLGWDDAIKGNEQIWTQGQGKYTSHWLPSFDDMNEKVEFNLSFVFEEDFTVIANGKNTKTALLTDGQARWSFDMQQPMSSYLIGFAIGDFNKTGFYSKSGVLNEMYYLPKDSLQVEPTYRYSKRIFDFLEKEIGVDYPWQNYKQIPVQDFLYAGMENTGATIFSNTFMVDSIAFLDKNYVNVNAHEMAHQWFGNLVTEQSGHHHWLHEGFATFYAYLSEKEVFGEDYFYWRLFETAKALQNFSGDGNGEALTNANAGSLTFYEKGAWALVMLRERIGDEPFREGIKNYLNTFAFQNVTIPDFMWEMEKASGMKLDDFEEQWLQESEFPFGMVKEFLKNKSESLHFYFSFKEEVAEQPELLETRLSQAWDDLDSDLLKHQLILDYGKMLSTGFLNRCLDGEQIKVRQAVALSIAKVPEELQSNFETLLEDKSYRTVEAVLYRLWTDFPGHQNTYLDKTQDMFGFANKNIRLLWLTLALISPEYRPANKRQYFNELSSYTGPEHHFEVRLLSFQYLKSIGGFNDSTLKNLIQACNHHVWHFKKSTRKMLKDFLEMEDNYARVKAIYPSLNLEQQEYLDKTMGK